MIYLHKILPLLISPLTIALAVIVYGTWRSRKNAVIASVVALYLLSTPVVSKYIFTLIEGPAYRLDPTTLPDADAIVVLSGMLIGVPSFNGIVYEWSDSDRFFAGIELFRLSKAPKLIFTGGKLPWNSQTETEGVVLKRFAENMGVPSSQILMTDEVINTDEEAKAVKRLLPASHPRVLLVTSAFHMQRSVRLFESQGMTIAPYPVDFRVEIRDTTPMDFLPEPGSLALTSLAVREQIGRTFYWLRSQISVSVN